MKANKHTNRILTLTAIMSLIVLLLLSPCKVRNSIESSLGIEETEVLNLNKSTLDTASCSVVETVDALNTTTKLTFSTKSGFSVISSLIILPNIEFEATLFTSIKERYQYTALIPYYILYLNFKAYIATTSLQKVK